MGKFDGILICTDLDGTLFKNDKTISNENKQAIEYFKREGGYFTFITGRMPYHTEKAYNTISPNVPYGTINGGAIYDGAKKEYVWKYNELTNYVDLVDMVTAKYPKVGVITCTYNVSVMYNDNMAMEFYRKATNSPPIFCHYAKINEPVAKIMFCTEIESDLLGVQKLLNEHKRASEFDFIRSEAILYEILPKGQNKGLTLQKLTQHLNVDIKKTIAVGDFYNDISMIKRAGVGIAVANACKDALSVADYITVSNEEHAIAQIINDIESGKIKFE